MKMLGSLLALFSKQERGAALILFAVLIPVMMGIIGLVLDGGRVFIMNNEQQDLADSAALAGASKLDGTAEGMAAAEAAARGLIDGIDPRGLTEGADGVQIDTIRFCRELVPIGTDFDAWNACILANPAIPDEANFIEVRTVQRDVSPVFTVALGADDAVGSRTIAIAGSTIVACNVQPLMLCNPFEPAAFTATVGQMFEFMSRGNGPGNEPSYAPGDFGLLDPPGQNTSTGPELRNLLSSQVPRFCYINEVSPRPGHAAGNFDNGINVRFDRRPQQNNGMDITPAPNVIKGHTTGNGQGACQQLNNSSDLGDVARLPRDPSWQVYGSLRVGTARPSSAARNAYWQFHHGADWPANVSTRYEAYLREIEMINDGTWGSGQPENPNPQCTPSPGGPERRVLSVVIVDCDAQDIHGNTRTDVRSDRYADFFITEPADNGYMWAEFIRMLEVGEDDGKLRRIVQLYR